MCGETVEHGDVCPLDAQPSALTACETDLHGNVSIVFGDRDCISGYVVLLVALPISFALGAVSEVLGSLPHCCAAPVVWLCPLPVNLDVVDSASCTAAAALFMCFVASFQVGPKLRSLKEKGSSGALWCVA